MGGWDFDRAVCLFWGYVVLAGAEKVGLALKCVNHRGTQSYTEEARADCSELKHFGQLKIQLKREMDFGIEEPKG